MQTGVKYAHAHEVTDMLKAKEGDFFVKDWLRNRNTLEFIGFWEAENNPNFKWGEFALLASKAGLNSFKISVDEFVEKTNAMCLISKKGNGGGTFAHQDIALEFGMWISPRFKVYLIKEFKRLKQAEQNNLDWSVRRELTYVECGFIWQNRKTVAHGKPRFNRQYA